MISEIAVLAVAATTAYRMPADRMGRISVVTALVAVGVLGIGIGTGLTWNEAYAVLLGLAPLGYLAVRIVVVLLARQQFRQFVRLHVRSSGSGQGAAGLPQDLPSGVDQVSRMVSKLPGLVVLAVGTPGPREPLTDVEVYDNIWPVWAWRIEAITIGVGVGVLVTIGFIVGRVAFGVSWMLWSSILTAVACLVLAWYRRSLSRKLRRECREWIASHSIFRREYGPAGRG